MATTRLYLDCRSKAKDGKGNVIITLFHNHSTASFPTGIRILPSEWNGSNVIKHPNADALNALLTERKLKIDKSIMLLELKNMDFVYLTASEIKNEISDTGSRIEDKGHLISDLFHEYMNRDLSDGTKEIYRTTLKKVIDFSGSSTTMESINAKFLYGFENYLARTQGINGRAIYLRHFRAVCKYAVHLHIIPECPFNFFKIKHEPTKKRSVNVDIFRKFVEFEASPTNKMYRDYFLLSFFLIGINVKDLLLAKPSQIVDGRLEYVRAKTHKFYSIKIEPEAQRLIDMYAGKDYLLNAMDTHIGYTNFANRINKGCQSIGPTIEVYDDIFSEPQQIVQPIIPGITTYFTRHSWATFASEIGIPIDVISRALGHPIGNPTTLIYIKPDRSQIDRANRAVIDYVFGSLSLESPSLL